MTKTSVTYEQVAKVCNRLQAENKSISVRTIHAETGGSHSTILDYYQTWQKENSRLTKEASGLSDTVASALNTEISRHVNDARFEMSEQIKQAEGRASEAREFLRESEEKIITLTEEALASVRENEKVVKEFESKLLAAEQRATYSVQKTSELEQTLKTMQADLTTAEKRAGIAEARAKDREEQIRQLQITIESLKTDLALKKDSEKELAAAKQEASFLHSRITVLEKNNSGLQDKLTISEKAAAVAQTQVESLRKQVDSLKSNSEILQKLVDEERTDLSNAERKAAVAEAKLDRTEQDMEAFKTVIAAMEDALEKLGGPEK